MAAVPPSPALPGAAQPLVVPALYEGPPGSANGGLGSGLIAGLLGGDAEVTLRAPLPLGRPLAVEHDGPAALRVLDPEAAGALVAEARALPLPALAVPHVTRAEAEAAPAPGDHPHDRCFVCGTHRDGGLRFLPRPGRPDAAARVPDEERDAAPWRLWVSPFDARPDLCDGNGRVRPELLWGVLDCIGSWAPVNRRPPWAMRTGRIHAGLRAAVHEGERCVVVAWSLGRERRKHLVGSAVLGEDGGVRAEAVSTWILPAGMPGRAGALEGS